MASRILLPLLRPHPTTSFSLPLKFGLGLSSLYCAHTLLSAQPSRTFALRCDSVTGAMREEYGRYQTEAKVPVMKGGRLNPGAVKQISTGSIAGLLAGLAVSVFSKPLALLIGLLVLGVQAIEYQGIHIVPYGRLQKLFRNTDIRSALEDNVALKLSFGTAFALAGFMEF